MIPAALLLTTLAQDKVTHPAGGSPIRKEILDAIRPYTYEKDLSRVKFVVPYMAVQGNTALVYCVTDTPDPEQLSDRSPFRSYGELTAAFLVKRTKKWVPIGFIIDAHEGALPGEGWIIDLRSLEKSGFTRQIFPNKTDDMSKTLGVLDDVKRLGFTYGLFIPNKENALTEFVAVSPKEIDSAKKLRGDQIMIRGAKADVFRPKMY